MRYWVRVYTRTQYNKTTAAAATRSTARYGRPTELAGGEGDPSPVGLAAGGVQPERGRERKIKREKEERKRE